MDGRDRRGRTGVNNEQERLKPMSEEENKTTQVWREFIERTYADETKSDEEKDLAVISAAVSVFMRGGGRVRGKGTTKVVIILAQGRMKSLDVYEHEDGDGNGGADGDGRPRPPVFDEAAKENMRRLYGIVLRHKERERARRRAYAARKRQEERERRNDEKRR